MVCWYLIYLRRGFEDVNYEVPYFTYLDFLRLSNKLESGSLSAFFDLLTFTIFRILGTYLRMSRVGGVR